MFAMKVCFGFGHVRVCLRRLHFQVFPNCTTTVKTQLTVFFVCSWTHFFFSFSAINRLMSLGLIDARGYIRMENTDALTHTNNVRTHIYWRVRKLPIGTQKYILVFIIYSKIKIFIFLLLFLGEYLLLLLLAILRYYVTITIDGVVTPSWTDLVVVW